MHRSVFALCALIACAPVDPDAVGSVDRPIRGGADGSALQDQVFKIESFDGTDHGTGSLVRYPRCLLTARHIAGGSVLHMDGRDQNLGSWESMGHVLDGRFTDLQVVWAHATTHPDALTFDGAPLEFRPSTLAGLPNAEFGNLRQWSDATHLNPPTVPAGPTVSVYGYGPAAAGGAWGEALRVGTLRATQEACGPCQDPAMPGAVMVLLNDNGHGLCGGDSGGPVLDADGKIIAVASGSSDPSCAAYDPNTVEASYATTITADADDWIDRAIERVCGKDIAVSISGSGSVDGDRQGGDLRTFSDEDPIDGDLYCADDALDETGDDCRETLHEGETMTLTATAAAGWTFDRWEGDECFCDGSQDAACELDFETMGEYTATLSRDDDTCTAVFTCDTDADGDGVAECEDCDDNDPTVGWAGSEVCDGVDNDCNGLIDEVGDLTFYADADGDGYGDPLDSIEVCESQSGYVDDNSDCDDDNADIHPMATESCNGEDDDCDGQTDEEGMGGGPWYLDADGDGHGDPQVIDESCDAPTGYVGDGDDCNDNNAASSPSGSAACDGIDNDCDGIVDANCGAGSGGGAGLPLTCGTQSFAAPDDSVFYVTTDSGESLSGWVSGGVVGWCDPGDSVDAWSWGTTYSSPASGVDLYEQTYGGYCPWGEVSNDLECPASTWP